MCKCAATCKCVTCNCVSPLHAHAAGLSCAIITGAAYIVCAVAYAVAPAATLAFFGFLFHGIDLLKVATTITLSGVISGFIIAFVGTYIIVRLCAALYNRIIARACCCVSDVTSSGGDSCCAA